MKKIAWALLCLSLCLGAVCPLSACKKTKNYASSGLAYAIINGECTIMGIGTCSDTDVVVPESIEGAPVTTIAGYAFRNCRRVTSVTLPQTVVRVNEGAFYNCIALSSVRLNDGLSYLGDSVFFNCAALASVTLPQSVTHLGARAFEACQALTSLHIPAAVAEVGEALFCNCSSLSTLSVDDNNEHFRNGNNCLIRRSTGELVAGCEFSVIPDDGTVTRIGNSAFEGSRSLTELVLPSSVTEIGSRAFADCPSLRRVVLSDNVRRVETGAFDGCEALEWNVRELLRYLGSESNPYLALICPETVYVSSADIPAQTKVIAERAMYGCFSLRSVTLGAGVEVIGKEAFLNCTRLTEAIFSNTEGWHIVIGTYHMETHTHAPPENARLLIEEYVFYEWVRH
ncbi:MAG: leucine-rich repeat domain-containing protein [Clostridia bacterium]|nr:leucine-rich repeat domain-containing protein [Clostridia bacterium]